ncbi:MAG TPA: LytTR family transcriptional regulator DNA-binding domain-containing protein [Chitinophagales bacterium]|nr:LytTR family transcriptional regulator DNA-binding domain-containing protein [Chitinophagales bacterium]
MKSFDSALSSFKSNLSKKLLNEKPHQFFFYQIEINNDKIRSLFLDENVVNVTGYKKEELNTKGFKDLKIFDNRYLRFVQDIFLEASKSPQHFEFDAIVIHKEGHIVLVKNRCMSYINPITNLKEIRGTTELITEVHIENYSKTAISKLINIAYDFGLVGTFYYDIKANAILWSDESKKMHGLTTEPTMQEFLKNAKTKSEVNINGLIENILESKDGFQSLYKFYRESDHTYRNILAIIFPIIDKNKNLIGLSGNMIDIFDESVSIAPNNNTSQIEKIHPEKDSIFIKHHNQYIKINYKEILAISSLRDYVQIYTTNRANPYTYYTKLYKLKESLPEEMFVQIHRSHIVNIQQIQKIADNNIVINDMNFPISRNYKAQLMEMIK